MAAPRNLPRLQHGHTPRAGETSSVEKCEAAVKILLAAGELGIVLPHTDMQNRSKWVGPPFFFFFFKSKGSGRTPTTVDQFRLHIQRPNSALFPAQIPLQTWLEYTAHFWNLTWPFHVIRGIFGHGY